MVIRLIKLQDAAEPNRKPLKPPRLTGTASNRAENRTGGTGPGNGTEPEKPDRVVRAEPAEQDRHPAQPNRTEPNRTHDGMRCVTLTRALYNETAPQ